MKNSNTCPFGEKFQKYWDKRYQLFSKFDEGIQVDEQALFSITPEQHAIDHAKRLKGKIVLDALGCVGGNAIAFAQYCKKVYMIELDENRIKMAENNARVYGVSNKIEFIHGDYFDEAPKIEADVVYLDPPWGGPDYIGLKKFKLDNFSPNGHDILELAFKHFPQVVMRIPRNFDPKELKQLKHEFEEIDDYSGEKLVTKTVYFK
ncbi:MAG: RsmD family RNA methyltransferase [Patescibacteria group bacterium]